MLHPPASSRRASLRSVLVLGLLVGLLTSTATTVGVASPAEASDAWFDLSRRQEVIDTYESEFSKVTPDVGWTGDRSSCTAGTTNPAYRQSIIDRVNWFRGMAGVPTGITENATYSAHAQEAALMMSETGQLSHSPDTSYDCYTSNGRTAAGSSNLYLGRSGPDAIDGYMYDPGANNASVGHRSWILHPTTRQMGTGDLPATGGWTANTLWVFDDVFGTQPALRESDGFVAWPPRGYVPGEVVYPRWSFSIRGANFDSASVSVAKVSSNGATTSVAAPVEHRSSTNGAPFSILVFGPSGVDTAPAVDTVYRVSIANVGVNGSTKNFSYDVVVIGDQPAVLASVDADNGSDSQVVDTTDYTDFIIDAYVDFLGREPDDAEINGWSDRLSRGAGRYEMIGALAGSDEWIAFVVDQMYLDTLGRTADADGRAFWISVLKNGSTVAEVAASFYGSPEYVELEGGTYELWLRDLYAELLQRTPDSGGVEFWRQQAEARGTARIALEFYQSEESRKTRVEALFETILGRRPDAAGLEYWAEILKDGNDIALATNLGASTEYVDNSLGR